MRIKSTGKFAMEHLLGEKYCQVCGTQVTLENGDVFHEDNDYYDGKHKFYFYCPVCGVQNYMRVPDPVVINE